MCQCHFVSKDNISRCTDVLNFIKSQLWLSHIYSNMWYQSNKSATFLVICLKCFHFITCIRTQPMSLRYPCKLNFMSQRGKKDPDKNTLRKKIFISKHSYVIMTHELLWYLIDSKKKEKKYFSWMMKECNFPLRNWPSFQHAQYRMCLGYHSVAGKHSAPCDADSYFLFWEMQKCDNSLPEMTVKGGILWNKPTECFLLWVINRFFSLAQHNEVFFLPKLKSSTSIEIFCLSSNILINWKKCLSRSYRKLVSGLEQKLGRSLTSNSKWETKCIPKTNMNGFRNALRRN